MIACQCHGVSDKAIRAAIRSGAGTVAGVGAACAAGTDCGGCHGTIERLIQIERAGERTSRDSGEALSPCGPLWHRPAPA